MLAKEVGRIAREQNMGWCDDSEPKFVNYECWMATKKMPKRVFGTSDCGPYFYNDLKVFTCSIFNFLNKLKKKISYLLYFRLNNFEGCGNFWKF